MTEQEIIKIVKDRRDELGISKYAIVKAKSLSSVGEIDKLERGEKTLYLNTIIRYMDYLGMELVARVKE
nr:MAG TPA: Transcriptional regulator, Transcriptional activator, TPR, HTH [Caudoviricetes sp.]